MCSHSIRLLSIYTISTPQILTILVQPRDDFFWMRRLFLPKTETSWWFSYSNGSYCGFLRTKNNDFFRCTLFTHIFWKWNFRIKETSEKWDQYIGDILWSQQMHTKFYKKLWRLEWRSNTSSKFLNLFFLNMP